MKEISRQIYAQREGGNRIDFQEIGINTRKWIYEAQDRERPCDLVDSIQIKIL